MSFDPIEADLEEGLDNNVMGEDDLNVINMHPSDAWTNWRMELAHQMFNEWQASRNVM